MEHYDLRELRVTWDSHRVAMDAARYDARRSGVRHRVFREDGEDSWGPYRWRIAPVVVESCS